MACASETRGGEVHLMPSSLLPTVSSGGHLGCTVCGGRTLLLIN